MFICYEFVRVGHLLNSCFINQSAFRSTMSVVKTIYKLNIPSHLVKSLRQTSKNLLALINYLFHNY